MKQANPLKCTYFSPKWIKLVAKNTRFEAHFQKISIMFKMFSIMFSYKTKTQTWHFQMDIQRAF